MKLYAILIAACLLACGACKSRTNDETLEQVTIYYVPLDTKPPVMVRCGELKKVYGKKVKSIVLSGPMDMDLLRETFKKAVSAKERIINVKAKFILKYVHHTETYCMDKYGALEGEKDLLYCPELVPFVKSLR
jgi:hypothetical protein